MLRCAANTAKGEQCKGLVKPGNDYCPAHDPERVEARRLAASKAGRSKPGSEIAEVKSQLRKLADDTLAEKVDRGTASVVSQVLGVWLKAVEVQIRERETTVKEREFTEIRLPEFEQLQQEVTELREMVATKDTTQRRSPWAG